MGWAGTESSAEVTAGIEFCRTLRATWRSEAGGNVLQAWGRVAGQGQEQGQDRKACTAIRPFPREPRKVAQGPGKLSHHLSFVKLP